MRPFLTSTLVLGLSAALGGACSSSSSGPCAQRSGTYLQQYTTRSGDCGTISEQIVTITKQPTSIDAPCSGSIKYTADNCHVTYEVVCPITKGPLAGGKTRAAGTTDWNQDGSHGSAIEQQTDYGPDGRSACDGSYGVVLQRR